jgi:cation diffusion facilitator family transporter
MIENNKTKDIKKAAIVALCGNAVLALLKIIAGLISGSGALLSDGIDSSSDALISIITLVVVRIISKPADALHPWGHGRAETVTTAFFSFMLFFMGGQLIISSVSDLLFGEPAGAPSFLAMVVSVISIVGKLLLAFCQYALGKRSGSAMLKANAKNMLSDVLVSIGVLVGLVISTLTGSANADTIIAGLIGLWIIKTAVGIFLEANLELMDGNSDIKPYHIILEAVNAVKGASNPHRARMRSVAGFWDIDFDIDVDPDCTISEAHDIACQVETEIKNRLENVLDIMIHVEPQGDENDETFGLSEEMMRKEKHADR